MYINNDIKPNIDGLLILSSDLHHDERGYFLENWRKVDLEKFGVSKSLFLNKLQNNVSVSKKGTIRGMHCQGYEKIMTVAYGKFRMIFIDLRFGSKTYEQIDTIDVVPGMSIYVPSGVANGAQSLVDDGILNYLVADYYDPDKDYLGIMPLDEDLKLNWDFSSKPIVSNKDMSSKSYADVLNIVENNKQNIALIGSTGAVGSVLFDQLVHKSDVNLICFNRSNITELTNNEYDVFICTAPSSEKLLTNLGLKNSDSEIFDLISAIEQVKTKHFILVSTKSIFDSGSKYSEVHQKVYSSVVRMHKNHTVYVLDTLYGDTLVKGFIHDIISKEWTYLDNEIVEQYPDLRKYYVKLTDSLWKLKVFLPNEIISILKSIEDLYPNDMCFQITSIDDLVYEIISDLDFVKGIKIGIDSSMILTGLEVKNLRNNPDESTLGQYFKKRMRS